MIKHWSLAFGMMTLVLIVSGPLTSFSAQEKGPKIPDKIAPFFQPPRNSPTILAIYKSPLKFNDGTPVKNAADWKKRRQEILKTWHELLGPWPELIKQPKIEFLSKEKRENFTQYHVRIEVAPGRMTDDAFLLVPDGDGPFPAVVVVFYEAKTGIGQGKGPHRDFAYQLAKRGFVTLSVGGAPETYYPNKETGKFSRCRFMPTRPPTAGKSWPVFPTSLPSASASSAIPTAASGPCSPRVCSRDFACACWIDPGIVFDEKRSNVNYWERWYLGHEIGKERKPGIPSDKNPRTGPYKKMIEAGHDLHELHVLMAPRPFLVSGGAEDPPLRWKALNHSVAVNRLLGYENRVAMTNRPMHSPNEESNEQMFAFFEHFLLRGK